MYLPTHMFLVRFIFCISVWGWQETCPFLNYGFQKQIILHLVETSCRTHGINNSLGWGSGWWIQILWLIMVCQNSHCWCMGPLSILKMTVSRATLSLVLKCCDWGKVLKRMFSISWYLKVPRWMVALFKGDLRLAWKSSYPQRRRPEHFSRVGQPRSQAARMKWEERLAFPWPVSWGACFQRRIGSGLYVFP